MKIGILVIDNGLGHLKRQSLLANHLSKLGHQIDIYCNKNRSKKIFFNPRLSINHLPISTSDIQSGIVIRNKLKKIPYKKYNIIISDNIIDILDFYPKAIIFGSFFWHHAISVSQYYFRKSERLLRKYKPLILANRYFAPQYIKERKNVKLISLISNFTKKKNLSSQKDILISTGLGGTTELPVNKLIELCKPIAQKLNIKIWVEPKYFEETKHEYLKKATYTREMYNCIKVAIIRPGIGTITDLLTSKSIIVAIYEKNNKEMIHNAKVLQKLGHYDTNLFDIKKVLKKAFYSKHQIYLDDNISFKGIYETTKILQKL